MRVLVDYRPALRARTGVGHYMHELVRAYAAAFPADDVAAFTSSWKDRPRPDTGASLGARVIDRRIPVRALNALWHRVGWPPVEWLTGDVDVVHAAHPLLIPAARAAQVVMVHDLFFLDHPERTSAEIRRDYAALAPLHARRAHAVVVPSAYTAGLVRDRLGVPLERIYVCPPGAPAWATLGRRPNVPEDGYVLFVGTLEPRKNLGVLLDAYERLAARAVPCPPLRIAGAPGHASQPWLDRLQRPPLDRLVRYVGYVDDGDREALFAGARTLVLPSLDEGFGIPVLEAMSAGIPVIAANRGALPEVAGSAGLYFDAGNADELASLLQRLATDRDTALERAHAGLERARQYQWSRTAASVRTAYRDAIARRAGRPVVDGDRAGH